MEPDAGHGASWRSQLYEQREQAPSRALDHADRDSPRTACSPTFSFMADLGLPAMDVFGAGLASSIVSAATFVGSACGLPYMPPLQEVSRARGRFLWRPDWVLMRKLVVVGAPISERLHAGVRRLRNGGPAHGTARYDRTAAHQITLQTASILWMVAHRDLAGSHGTRGPCRGGGTSMVRAAPALQALALGAIFMA